MTTASLKVKMARYLQGRTWFVPGKVSRQARQFGERLPAGSLVLEIGCGSGVDAHYLAERHHVVACDVRGPGAACFADIHSLPFRTNTFDGVFCRGVLHLAESVDGAVDEIRRVAKMGALVFMSYPVDIGDDTEYEMLCGELDESLWAKLLQRDVTKVHHGDHWHNIVQLWCRNDTFHHNSRIFIEVVTGCRNLHCTSPCVAREAEIALMEPTICGEIIEAFMGKADIYLFGSGDASIYPFEDIPAPLQGCNTIVTNDHFAAIPKLKSLGLSVFARCDDPRYLHSREWERADGVFCVAGERTPFGEIAAVVLAEGVPFMVRSLCNNENHQPPPMNDARNQIEATTGWRPYQTWFAESPKFGCNVSTVTYKAGQFKMQRCLLLEKETAIADTIEEVLSWYEKDWFPCYECYTCGHQANNYRLYYEPKRRRNDHCEQEAAIREAGTGEGHQNDVPNRDHSGERPACRV